MELTVKGKQIDVGDALRGHVNDQLGHVVEKYFQRAQDATVTFSTDAHLHKADLQVHVGRGILLQSSAEAPDIYVAFDTALDKMEKRLRRYKRRLRDHHQRRLAAPPEADLDASAFVLEGPIESPSQGVELADNGEEEQGEPAVIAEMTTPIETMSVAEAVMRLDLAQAPALLFRNGAHNGINMIYRRPDGHIGWVDPKGNQNTV